MPDFFFGLATYLANKKATVVNKAIKLDPLTSRALIQSVKWTETLLTETVPVDRFRLYLAWYVS